MATLTDDTRPGERPAQRQEGGPARVRGPARRPLRKLVLTGLAGAVMMSAAATPVAAQANTIGATNTTHYAVLTPTGFRWPPPTSGPNGTAQFRVSPYGQVSTRLLWDEVGPLIYSGGTSPCSTVYQSGGAKLYVMAAGRIVAWRGLPPGTCNTTSDSWSATPQIAQVFLTNPSNVIIYVQAPPGQPGSPVQLPGGVVLNPGSIWSHVELAPQDGGGCNC